MDKLLKRYSQVPPWSKSLFIRKDSLIIDSCINKEGVAHGRTGTT